MLRTIVLCFSCLLFYSLRANEVKYEDRTYTPTVKTVLLHPLHDDMRNAIIELGSDDVLVLKFDELTDEIENYEYNIVACNADWTGSMMFPYEYIDGFQTMPVYDFRVSANTNNIRYVHYWFTFPNNQLSLKKSGNYVVNVFKSGYPDSVILTKRFMVYEPLVEADMFSQRSAFSQYYNTHQELHFNVRLNRYEVQHALSEIKVTLMQNFRWDNAMHNIQPVFVNDALLQFYRQGKYVFPAGKEFRYFDIRNMLVRNERIQSLGATKTDTVYLYADTPRKNETYRFLSDINGRFVTGSYPWSTVEWEGNYDGKIFGLAGET
jgi:hypothetical protein